MCTCYLQLHLYMAFPLVAICLDCLMVMLQAQVSSFELQFHSFLHQFLKINCFFFPIFYLLPNFRQPVKIHACVYYYHYGFWLACIPPLSCDLYLEVPIWQLLHQVQNVSALDNTYYIKNGKLQVLQCD